MPRSFRTYALTFCLYLLVSVIVTFPAIITLNTAYIGSTISDSPEVIRHIWWFKYALANGLDPFYQSHLGYPAGMDGSVFLSVPLYFFPTLPLAYIFPLPAAFNLTIIFNLALNGLAMFALGRHLLRGNHAAAFIGGLVFLAFPLFQTHLVDGHTGLVVMWAVPLYALSLFKLVERERLSWRWLLAAVVTFWLSPMGHILQAVYVLLPLTACFGLARLWRRDWRGAGRVILASGAGALLTLIYLLPVISQTLSEPAFSDTGGYVRYSADLLAPVSPSFFHPLWDAVLDYPRRVLGINPTEGMAYVGLIVGLLLIIGAVKYRAARWWLLLGIVAFVLSLGPAIKLFDQPVTFALEGQTYTLTTPWAGIYTLPGMNLARTPGRFNFTLALAVAALAGYGAQFLLQRVERRRIAVAAVGILSALILLDYQSYFPMPSQPAAIPDAVHALRERDDVRAVYNVPQDNLLAAKDALYLQTAHEKPLIAGQVTRQTPVNPAKLAILAQMDTAQLNAAGADVVILHRERARAIDQLETLERRLNALGAPLYEDARIAIYETPDTDAPPEMTLIAPDATPGMRYDAHVYVPAAGWYRFDAALTADARDVSVMIDGQPVSAFSVDGETGFSHLLPLPEAGYSVISLALTPPCPPNIDAAKLCRMMRVANVNMTPEMSLQGGVAFEQGIVLGGYSAPVLQNDAMIINLWWQFNEAVSGTDVRFVHLVAPDGTIADQSDVPPGVFAAGAQLVEQVRLSTEALAAGEYAVRVGWYDFNTLTNYAPETGGAFIEAGTITLR